MKHYFLKSSSLKPDILVLSTKGNFTKEDNYVFSFKGAILIRCFDSIYRDMVNRLREGPLVPLRSCYCIDFCRNNRDLPRAYVLEKSRPQINPQKAVSTHGGAIWQLLTITSKNFPKA